MSETVTHPAEPVVQPAAPGLFRKRRRSLVLAASTREGLVVFAVAFAAYGALGVRLVVGQHVVVFDALARLAHAYFVWFNDPPKLASVGFVWPPVATFVFLPFSAVKPLATSLAALPLTSAAFAAGLLVLLNATLRLAGMAPLLRYPLLAAFAVNPMIAFYASNGMSEIVYLFFLVAAVYYFLRWYMARTAVLLVVAALAFSVGILSRYEVFTWAVVLTGVIAAALIRQHVSRNQLEGTMIAYLAPVAYGVGLWCFFNWLILGDPLFFLRNQAPGGASNIPGASTVQLAVPGPPLPATDVAVRLLDLNWQLFPLTVIAFAALAVQFLVRRDLMALTMAMLLGLNAAFTWLIVFVSRAESYLQLRYNMRAMPLAIVAVAWLYLSLRDRRARLGVWAVALVVLVATLPSTWRTMQTYPIQYLEEAFTRAVATGEDQEGTGSVGGYGVGIAPQRAMAEYIREHVPSGSQVLTDDARTFSVMLLEGDPGRFLDRIDGGDDAWLRVRDDPFGRVAYVLVSSAEDDLVRLRYPGILAGTQAGFSTVFDSQGLVLARVASRRPGPSG